MFSSADAVHSRRQFLTAGAGLGCVALAWLLERDARCASSPYAAKPTHFPAKAKRIIQIFCCGGVSHIDTFDYKPQLAARDGQELTGKGKIDPFFGEPGRLMKSPFEFRQHGESGKWVSSLLPNLAECVDEITFLSSMTTKNNNHTPATFLANSGFTMNGYPSMGAWFSYGLGSENEELPAFLVLPDPRGLPAGGSINWASGFLPATHQGVALRTGGSEPIADLATPDRVRSEARTAGFAALAEMNRQFRDQHPGDDVLAARLVSYELAAKMQLSVPRVFDLSDESKETLRLYGIEERLSAPFGRNCLLARRFLERGVRFVQLFNGGAFGGMPRINWDAHENVVENHTAQSATLDQPVAGLLRDLKRRGMLHDTLVVWSTEFGRTPITQGLGAKGRDHHPHAFTCWLAGAGLKPGIVHGSSDEVGYFAAEKPATTYDLHATILHLAGLDHTKLTYYHNGIQRRLTDVHGHVIRDILA